MSPHPNVILRGIKDQVVDFVIFEDGGVIAIDAKGVDPKSKTTTATRQYDIAHRIRDYHLKGVEQAIRTLQNLEQKNYPVIEIEQYIQRFSAESLCQNGYPFGGDKAIDCFEVLCEQIISNIEETRRNWYEINSLQKRVNAFYHNYIEFIDLMVKSEPKQ